MLRKCRSVIFHCSRLLFCKVLRRYSVSVSGQLHDEPCGMTVGNRGHCDFSPSPILQENSACMRSHSGTHRTANQGLDAPTLPKSDPVCGCPSHRGFGGIEMDRLFRAASFLRAPSILAGNSWDSLLWRLVHEAALTDRVLLLRLTFK